jgi:hypothetical protein
MSAGPLSRTSSTTSTSLAMCGSTTPSGIYVHLLWHGRPGFADEPECFSVDAYALDEDNWTDGFVTVAGSSEQTLSTTVLICGGGDPAQ